MEKLRLHCPEFSETSKNGFTESLKHLALSVQKLRKISHRNPEGPQPRDGEGKEAVGAGLTGQQLSGQEAGSGE